MTARKRARTVSAMTTTEISIAAPRNGEPFRLAFIKPTPEHAAGGPHGIRQMRSVDDVRHLAEELGFPFDQVKWEDGDSFPEQPST